MISKKKTIVLAAGIFDIIHLGHIHFLKHAKSLGDELVVVIGSDRIARKAGKYPVHNEKERLKMIKAIGVVDRAMVGHRRDMLVTLKKIKPDIVFLGYDQELAKPLWNYCQKHKIKVMKDACKLNPRKYKTTMIKKRVINSAKAGGNTADKSKHKKAQGRYDANTLLHLSRKNAIHCPWCRDCKSEMYVHELKDEVRELLEAFEKKDYRNVREEIGDVIWDAIVLAHICEREGKFKGGDVIEGIIKKIERRKPYLIEGRNVTVEEAKKIWQEAKRKEKQA